MCSSDLSVSRYAYAPVFSGGDDGDRTAIARLGPEVQNPAYRPHPSRTLPLEQRQQLLWAGVLMVVSVTAMAVFFSSKQPR